MNTYSKLAIGAAAVLGVAYVLADALYKKETANSTAPLFTISSPEKPAFDIPQQPQGRKANDSIDDKVAAAAVDTDESNIYKKNKTQTIPEYVTPALKAAWISLREGTLKTDDILKGITNLKDNPDKKLLYDDIERYCMDAISDGKTIDYIDDVLLIAYEIESDENSEYAERVAALLKLRLQPFLSEQSKTKEERMMLENWWMRLASDFHRLPAYAESDHKTMIALGESYRRILENEMAGDVFIEAEKQQYRELIIGGLESDLREALENGDTVTAAEIQQELNAAHQRLSRFDTISYRQFAREGRREVINEITEKINAFRKN